MYRKDCHCLSMYQHARPAVVSRSDNHAVQLTNAPSNWFRDIARELGREFRKQDAEAAASLPRLGNVVKFNNSKAERLLNIRFREPGFVEMGYTIIEKGIVKKTRGYTGIPEQMRQDIEK